MISCDIDMKTSGLSKFTDNATSRAKIRIPQAEGARREMLVEMRGAKKNIGVELDQENGWIYALPSGESRDKAFDSMSVNYICLCIAPGVPGGTKSVENKLEMLMMPRSFNDDRYNQLNPNMCPISHACIRLFKTSSCGEGGVLQSFEQQVLLELCAAPLSC